jgi:hypothetical protein
MLVPGHLKVTTVPSNADLWIDGVWQGKTPLDATPGPGAHRVVIIAAGHFMLKQVYETTDGEIIRRSLSPVEPPTHGNAYLDIECRNEGKLPIFIDDLETGLLCPARMVPVAAGRRKIAIYDPIIHDFIAQEIAVSPSATPLPVRFRE